MDKRRRSDMDEELANLCRNVRRWRLEMGLTTEELGDKSGISFSLLKDLEGEKISPASSIPFHSVLY